MTREEVRGEPGKADIVSGGLGAGWGGAGSGERIRARGPEEDGFGWRNEMGAMLLNRPGSRSRR